jgi:hypothetical protein
MLNVTYAGKQPYGTDHATFAVTQSASCAYYKKTSAALFVEETSSNQYQKQNLLKTRHRNQRIRYWICLIRLPESFILLHC